MEFDGRSQGAAQSSFATRDSVSGINKQKPDLKANAFHRETQVTPANEARVSTHQEGSSAYLSTVMHDHGGKSSLMETNVRTVDVTVHHVQSPRGDEESVCEAGACIVNQDPVTVVTVGMASIRTGESANAVYTEEEVEGVVEGGASEASQPDLLARGEDTRSLQNTSVMGGEYEPETVSGASLASSDLSKDQFTALVNQARGFVNCLSSYHRCPDYLPMPQLIHCLINLPGKDLITFFEDTGLLALAALDWLDEHSNEMIFKVLTPALIESGLNLDQLKQLFFKPVNARQDSFFSQYLYVIRYAHASGIKDSVGMALMELLKAAAVDKKAAQRILRWITNVEVQKAGPGVFSSKKHSDVAKQLSASLKGFKKQAAKLDAATRRKGESADCRKEEATRYKDTAAHYKDEVSAFLKQYQAVLEVLSENVGSNKFIKKLKERAETALSSWDKSIGHKKGSIVGMSERPENSPVDQQPEQAGGSLSERVTLAIKEMQGMEERINKRRFHIWSSEEPEKEAPTAEQKVEQLKQRVRNQEEEITVLKQQVNELSKRVSVPPESSEGAQET